MSLNPSNYSNFATSSYKSFMSHLQGSLTEGTQVKECRINTFFLKKVNGEWERYTTTHNNTGYDTAIPVNDLDLYNLAVRDLASLPQEVRNHPTVSLLNSISTLPFDSPLIRAALTTFREIKKAEKSHPFIFIENDIKEAFKEVLVSDTHIIRPLKKEITVVYSLTSKPSVYYTASLEKDISRECSHCHEWETTAHKLSKCSRCPKTFYCNLECQRSDWKAHKVICGKK